VTRAPYLAGNWKMNLDRRGALDLVAALREGVAADSGRDVAIFPPFVYIDEVARAAAGSPIRVGGQNVCDETSGAFTGEVSAAMLLDVGAEIALVGHSERRHVYGEGDELINRKVHTALAAGLDVILCVGETLEQRQAGETEGVNGGQLTAGLEGVSAESMARVTLAYEPVWAIGTGHTASPEQAAEVHTYLRGVLAGLYDDGLAESVRIQYGGSVKPDNVSELMASPNVDGALVGGASLKADSFLQIVNYR
jgi:triosephosphate isomerase